MKLDIHLNLGQIPETRKRTPLYISPDQLYDYVKRNNLTHIGVIYYGKSEAERFLELIREDSVVCYLFQWVVDIEKVKLNEFDRGICVHSGRGTVDHQEYGLDYSRISHYLKKLPKDTIVYVHLQGSASGRNISRALSVSSWAISHPHLKFLMEHAGGYCSQFDMYPIIDSISEVKGGNIIVRNLYKQGIGSEACVQEACLVAKKLPNVFIDSSMFAQKNYKTDLLHNNNKWSYGSDYPFVNETYKIDKQMQVMSQYYDYDECKPQEIHQRGVDWIEASVDDLWKGDV
jgi:predicted TIM-barrel fold metal-dependent hydrolase